MCTAKAFCQLTGIRKHFFSYTLLSVCFINSKLRNLCNTLRMVQLLLESQIQSSNYNIIILANKAIIMFIVYLPFPT